jgi:regulator of cell morphogenesis and NO signaling
MTKNIELEEIIKEIVEEHFGYLKQELPVLKSLANKLLKVHYEDCKEELVNVHRAYGKVENELELGIVKKQINLFPNLWDYIKKDEGELLEVIKASIVEIKKDNDLAIKALEELKIATNNYTMPESGCQTYESTYKRMSELHKRVADSIEKEEILYKNFI